MKKILLSLSAVVTVFMAQAQAADTLTEFFTGQQTYYTSAGGYVTGNNEYGDRGKYMRFDSSMGLPSTGAITGVLLGVPVKYDNGGSFIVNVRDFNGGTPSAPIASTTVSIAAVDTSLAGWSIAENAVIYNVAVTFANPIVLNASSDLLIGITLPTTAGDTVNLISNVDGDFANAINYSWEQWSDNSFNSMALPQPNGWELSIAMAIYPVWNAAGGITEASISASVYPNPASTELNVVVNGEASNISIISMDGKVLSSQAVYGSTTTVDVSGLTSGVYVYEVTANDGSVIRDSFVKK